MGSGSSAWWLHVKNPLASIVKLRLSYLASLTVDTSTVGHKCECPDPLGLFVFEMGFVWLIF